MNQRILLQVRQHPIASGFILLYLAYWIIVLYTLLFNRQPGDEGDVGLFLMFSFVISVPYVIVLSLLMWLRKLERSFYGELLFISLVPIAIAMLTGLMQVLWLRIKPTEHRGVLISLQVEEPVNGSF